MEQILSELVWEKDDRYLVTTQNYEDASIISFPAGKALVQSLDFFTPIVNDPYSFGQIAAANSMSDIYAMGGEPYSAMNIVCFSSKKFSLNVLKDILRGGLDKIKEANALMAGGHSVEDEEIKYGLSVAGIVEPGKYATNQGICAGDQLLLTKPLGTGILATAVKAEWKGHEDLEDKMLQWAGRLNAGGAKVIRDLGLTGATDITGFGLGGHLLEMSKAARMQIEVWSKEVPIMEEAIELAGMGLIPAGSYANRHYCSSLVQIAPDLDSLIIDIIFDAQTSGGLVLAVPQNKMDTAREMLMQGGDLAVHIGQVREKINDQPKLYIL